MRHKIAMPHGPLEIDDAQEHEHQGIKFVVHRIPGLTHQYRASEWGTGYGFPNTTSHMRDSVVDKTKAAIERNGAEKIAEALKKLPTLNHLAEDSMGGIA